jgi:23S rRNA (adenine1618-N6)-methyltransferase
MKKENISKLHPRNLHKGRYDFDVLIQSCPALTSFVAKNKYGDDSINFFDPVAVKTLNKALLQHYYQIENWDIPQGYLCPPIPGRADYIHYVADLLFDHSNEISTEKKIKCLDIGVGANCVYPIIGNKAYDWSFVGTDIDKNAINSANLIIEHNPLLKDKIELRLQENKSHILKGIIQEDDYFDIMICNPPFHSSKEEAEAGSVRKLRNLKKKKNVKTTLNFGGQSSELWCEGGEKSFISQMIKESREFAYSCLWFTTLVSKEAHLDYIYHQLEKTKVTDYKTINMGQGNKISRIVAWRFQKL